LLLVLKQTDGLSSPPPFFLLSRAAARSAAQEKHDGTIRVSNAESGYLGTTMSIFLPVKSKIRMSADKAASAGAGKG
jgi:hypothetical protein